MEVVLKREDFIDLGLVATNCNGQKLNISINEALDFDLCYTFEKCHIEVKQLIKKVLLHNEESEQEAPTEYEVKLVNGNIFTENGKTFENLGLKRGLIYYAYSRYLLINEFNDSAVGQKTQNFQFSVPKTYQELKSMSDKYRNMAKAAMLSTYEWIALNRSEFPQLANCLDLDNCYCGNKNKDSFCSVNTTGYQLKSRNIKKRY